MRDYSKILYPRFIQKGICLKGLGADDAEGLWLFVQKNRPHLEEFDPFVSIFQSLADVRVALDKIQSLREQGKSLTCGIWDGNTLIGFMNGGIGDDRGLRLGYGIAKGYEGRGIMTATAQVMLDYAFDELDLPYAWLNCWVTNTRSRRLAERLGFSSDGQLLPADLEQGSMEPQMHYRLVSPRH